MLAPKGATRRCKVCGGWCSGNRVFCSLGCVGVYNSSIVDAEFIREFPPEVIARRCAEVRALRKPEKIDEEPLQKSIPVVSTPMLADIIPDDDSESYESLAELGESLRWCRGRKRRVRKLQPIWEKKER